MTRYELVRSSIAYFAASADEQLGSEMGADDAVNELPYPLEDMLACDEVTSAEAAHIAHFSDVVVHYCSQSSVKPWHNEKVLFHDPKWAEVRRAAACTLQRLSPRHN